MNTFALLLATALLAGPAAVFAHGSEAHDDAPKAAAVKEQKPWGIAGDASAARRTITLDMSDNMRFTPERISVISTSSIADWPEATATAALALSSEATRRSRAATVGFEPRE